VRLAEIIVFLVQALVLSLSGVMAPGPVTAAAIAAGTRSRHSGSLIAVGHAAVELPLMFLILAGIGVLFESSASRMAIGLIGGVVLVWMGAGMLKDLRTGAVGPGLTASRGPLATGFVLSITNPYFLLWWATVGLALAKDARRLGLFAFVLFTIVHWLCDLGWLEALSWTSFKGTQLLSQRRQKLVLGVCAAAMIFFGVIFIYRALW
jgi:threonine/homoserine/homoserine lactone efflux protein